MIWFVVMQVFSTLLEWLILGKKIDREKDLEILLLRRQLAILERKQDKPLRVYRSQPCMPSSASASARFGAMGRRWRSPIPFPRSDTHGKVHRRDVLGGIIHEYYQETA